MNLLVQLLTLQLLLIQMMIQIILLVTFPSAYLNNAFYTNAGNDAGAACPGKPFAAGYAGGDAAPSTAPGNETGYCCLNCLGWKY
jgi:hypothetical protein